MQSLKITGSHVCQKIGPYMVVVQSRKLYYQLSLITIFNNSKFKDTNP